MASKTFIARFRISTILICALLFSVGPVHALIIDDFGADQSLAQTGVGTTASSVSAVAPDVILGGERDIAVQVNSGVGTIAVDVDQGGLNRLEYAEPANAAGRARVVWDGVDGSNAINFTGLGGVDFTEGGVNLGILLQGVSADFLTLLTLTAWTDGGNSSTWTALVAGLSQQSVLALFTDFIPVSGAGVDFTNVGAFRLLIDPQVIGAVDVGLGQISVVIPEPGTFVLLGVSLLGLLGVVYRRRR